MRVVQWQTVTTKCEPVIESVFVRFPFTYCVSHSEGDFCSLSRRAAFAQLNANSRRFVGTALLIGSTNFCARASISEIKFHRILCGFVHHARLGAAQICCFCRVFFFLEGGNRGFVEPVRKCSGIFPLPGKQLGVR